MDINEILEIGKSADDYVSESQQTQVTTQQSAFDDMTSANVDMLDELVYGKNVDGFVLPEPKKKIYNPSEDLKRMTDIPEANFSKSRIPQAILESIKQNPLTVTPVSDPQLEALTKRIGGDGSFSRSLDILKQLDERDGKKNINNTINENVNHSYTQPQPQQVNVNIDYELIKTIVESVVDKKLSQYKQQLTESVSRGQSGNSLAVMNIKKDKFLFLDDDNNIFECQMVYKGKNKARKK